MSGARGVWSKPPFGRMEPFTSYRQNPQLQCAALMKPQWSPNSRNTALRPLLLPELSTSGLPARARDEKELDWSRHSPSTPELVNLSYIARGSLVGWTRPGLRNGLVPSCYDLGSASERMCHRSGNTVQTRWRSGIPQKHCKLLGLKLLGSVGCKPPNPPLRMYSRRICN